MHSSQVFQGQWEDVSSRHALDLKGHVVEIRILDLNPKATKDSKIVEGMFPQLSVVTEDDFRSAEWHGAGDRDF